MNPTPTEEDWIGACGYWYGSAFLEEVRAKAYELAKERVYGEKSS